MVIADRSFQDRVARGKALEKQIFDAVAKMLEGTDYEIVSASQSADMHDKIDAYIRNKTNKKQLTVQIKGRETGKDIIFEIMKDIDKGIEGRDMKGKAQLYIAKTPSGIVAASVPMMKQAVRQHFEKNGYGNGKYIGFEVRVTSGRGDEKQRKLMGFFSPSRFGSKISDVFK